jgi:glycosyltransferase involved in cell wall biosynthesis
MTQLVDVAGAAAATRPETAGAASELELTILMPCLDEAETLAGCVDEAREFLARQHVSGEVLVADNGSSDGSAEIARAHGARVTSVSTRGYGAALSHGIRNARGRYVIIGDCDGSYDFSRLEPFLERLRHGRDLVMGNRFSGGIEPGAMPFLHRYLGNPVLSYLGRLFFAIPVGDFHCGLRGFRRDRMLALDLRSRGMEFASEMVVRAALAGLSIAEVPTTLSPDGRSRAPHLRTWRDGWRHLRFLLMLSPRWLFLYPGLVLLFVGAAAQWTIRAGPVGLGHVVLDIHTMLFAAGAVVIGLQMALFALFVEAAGVAHGVLPPSAAFGRVVRHFSLERGVVAGLLIALAGFVLAVHSVSIWMATGLSEIEPRLMMRVVIPALTLLVAGFQIMLSSFVLSFLLWNLDD